MGYNIKNLIIKRGWETKNAFLVSKQEAYGKEEEKRRRRRERRRRGRRGANPRYGYMPLYGSLELDMDPWFYIEYVWSYRICTLV